LLFRSAPTEKGRNLTRRTLYLPALIVAAVLMACAAALLAISEKAEATFPGKNGKIAYVRDEGNDSEIYTINPGGRGETQLTHDHTGNYVPSYSPDGKKIVYSGSPGRRDTEIYTINAGGGGKTQLTNNHRDDFFPAYSPGGKKIVYMHDGANDSELYTIDVRTGHRVQLTNNDREDFYPSYSPDGKKIVYSGSSGSGDTEIYTINASGGDMTQVTNNNNDEFDPNYSPDGKRIAYTGLNRNYDKSAIYTISVRGGGISKVTKGSDPSYSPDGKKIAYTVYKGPFTGIYKINVGGGGKFRIAPRLEYAESPSWGSRP
jgi:TolB protein